MADHSLTLFAVPCGPPGTPNSALCTAGRCECGWRTRCPLDPDRGGAESVEEDYLDHLRAVVGASR